MPTAIALSGDPSVPRGLHRLVERHLKWLRVVNFSRLTIRARFSQLNAFVKWCAEHSIHKPKQVTKRVLEGYQRHVSRVRSEATGLPLSSGTQLGRLVAVRAFFKWLARKRLLRYSPAADMDLPRLEKRLPKLVLTHSQVERILSLPDMNTPLGLRDRAILESFYSTGLRRSELVSLRLDELYPERGLLIVNQGKGKKDRVVPIGGRALSWIKRYLDQARPALAGRKHREHLFLSRLGERLSPTGVSILVREYLDRAGVHVRGACHMFRHSMATAMLENGADIRYIQEMLGHADLKTTQIYTHVNPHKLKAIHEATHPCRLVT